MRDIAIERDLARRLHGVDVIVAGGSNALLADGTDRLRTGDTAQGGYPLIESSATGDPVAVVSTIGNYRYLGRLVVTFDEQGLILPAGIDPVVSGAFVADAQEVIATGNAAPSAALAAGIQFALLAIVPKDAVILGETRVYLNGDTKEVRTQETNLGNLTADSMLYAARQVAPGVTPGAFPQVGGFQFSFDARLPVGERLRTLLRIDDAGNAVETIVRDGLVVDDPDRIFRLVTLIFLAGGGDAYPFTAFQTADQARFNRVDLPPEDQPTVGLTDFADFGTEQDALAEYLASRYPDAANAYAVADT